jgi:group I intron endonuclease
MSISYASQPIEIWKEIPNYEGLYEASTFGNIRTVERKSINSLGYERFLKSVVCKQSLDKDLYKRITLTKNKKSKQFMVHRLIYKTFTDISDIDMISHLDKNKHNNNFSNLINIATQKKDIKESVLYKFYNNSIINFLDDNINSGVYKILNTYNNKFYIGSAKNFKKRFYHHVSLLNKNKHSNSYLQNSWNKYGQGNFKIEIVEECDAEDRLKLEQYYIDSLLPSYNICKLAIGGCRSEDVTKETRKKLSISSKNHWASLSPLEKEQQIKKLKKSLSNRIISDSEKKKRRESLLKTKPWLYGKENRKRAVQKSNKEKISKAVNQFTKTGIFLQSFNSLIDAATSLNKKTSSLISHCCKNKRKTAYGYIWKYKNNI